MAKAQGKAIETNMEGLKAMARMLGAIQEMRDKITKLQNERGLCWKDWDFAYEVDDILVEAGVIEDNSDIDDD